MARPARPGRSTAACARRRDWPAARGPRRRLASSSGHGSTWYAPLSSIHRGPCSFHRGLGRGTGRSRGPPDVILGAGLDTFAQRRPEIASRLRVFEVDQPGPQAWKRQRLIELGFGIPSLLYLVPVDFEAGDAW